MSADVDTAVLALLRAALTGYDTDRVHDGEVRGADWPERVISAPLPYVIFFTTPGYPTNPRMCGRRGLAVEFTINSVGSTRAQAKFMGQRSQDAIDGKRILNARRIARTETNVPVRRDDEWTRPDGGPLFIDTRTYSIAAH